MILNSTRVYLFLVVLSMTVCLSVADAGATSGTKMQPAAQSTTTTRITLALFRNENPYRVKITLRDSTGGAYADIQVGPHGINRTAIWPGTAVVSAESGKRMTKKNRITAEGLRRHYVKNHDTVYYNILKTSLVAVPFEQGRLWDR
jgi:hypothetical protein